MLKKIFFSLLFFCGTVNAQWYSGSIEYKYWDFNEAPLNFDFTKKEKEKMFKELVPKYITKPFNFPNSNKYYNTNKNNGFIYFYYQNNNYLIPNY